MTPRLHTSRLILLACAAALVLLCALWDWNWLRPVVERQASVALGREVHLRHIDADLSLWQRRFSLMAEGLTVSNPQGFSSTAHTASVEQLRVVLSLRGLWSRQLSIEQLALDAPLIQLERLPDGRNNWQFAFMQNDQPPAAEPWQVQIADLEIAGGRLSLLDPLLDSDVTLAVQTEGHGANGQLLAVIRGTYAHQLIEGQFRGDSALTLRTPERPYALTLELANGRTHIAMDGTLLQPLQLGGAAITLDLRGENLADLYALTRLPLPPTAPYRLKGRLDYSAQRLRFSDLVGRVGSSDLAGDLSIRLGGTRPQLTARLHSQRIVLADLAGFIGATPGAADAAGQTAEQKRQRARQQASGRVLPDTPLNLPKLRAADVYLSYVGAHIEGAAMPFDNIAAQLDIVDGRISLKPLSFAVGDGRIVLNLDLDARAERPLMRGDIDFRRLDLARLTRGTPLLRGSGNIGGYARIDTQGRSLAQMLGAGNGELKLFMSGGELRALLVDLAGLDLGNALLSALGLPRRTELRCLVADYSLDQGVMSTRTLLVDTGKANVIGEGRINLATEQLDYRLSTQPKQPSVAALSAPIRISGSFAQPKLRPEYAELGLRTGAAVALGVLLTPLAALLPTLQLGLGEDHDCGELVRAAQRTSTTRQ